MCTRPSVMVSGADRRPLHLKLDGDGIVPAQVPSTMHVSPFWICVTIDEGHGRKRFLAGRVSCVPFFRAPRPMREGAKRAVEPNSGAHKYSRQIEGWGHIPPGLSKAPNLCAMSDASARPMIDLENTDRVSGKCFYERASLLLSSNGVRSRPQTGYQ